MRDQNVTLTVGDTTSLALVLLEGDSRSFTSSAGFGESWPSARTIQWRSTNLAIATVTGSGVVRATGSGTTFIFAEVAGLHDSIQLRVLSSAPPASFVALSTGGAHSCALDSNGVAYCWGSRYSGETGDGHVLPFTALVSPTRVATSLQFRSISVGNDHSCAIAVSGNAYCWGDNAFGQLGTGTSSDQPMPVAVRTNDQFAAISSGSVSTCGVRLADHGAVCWGDGNAISSVYQAPSPEIFVSVTTGAQHRCALTNAGNAYCWGANGFGQLGTGANIATSVPTPVDGSHKFVVLSAGNDYTCGIDTDAIAFCWGIGNAGVLGNGTTISKSVPTRVMSTEKFGGIDAGTTHTCAVTLAGRAFCWGREFSGALGDGPPLLADPSATDLTFPTPVRVATDKSFNSISSSAFDHTCALTVEGTAYCWGNNKNGALGIGNLSWSANRSLSIRYFPTPVVPPI